MTLWLCNNPSITGLVLSWDITKVVAERAKAKIDRLLQERKVDAAGGLKAGGWEQAVVLA